MFSQVDLLTKILSPKYGHPVLDYNVCFCEAVAYNYTLVFESQPIAPPHPKSTSSSNEREQSSASHIRNIFTLPTTPIHMTECHETHETHLSGFYNAQECVSCRTNKHQMVVWLRVKPILADDIQGTHPIGDDVFKRGIFY